MNLIAQLLFLVLALPAWGAMNFDGTVDATADAGSTEITGTPLTICEWGRSASTAAYLTGAGLYDSAGGELFQLTWGNDAKIYAYAGHSGSFPAAVTSTTYSANIWAHVCAVFASSTSRSAYLNGGGSGSDTTNNTPTSIVATSVGFPHGAAVQQFDGDLAEVGIWNVALSDSEVLMLSLGFAPPCVRPDALVNYFPMVTKVGSTLPDVFGSTSLSLTLGSGTATASHPRIYHCQ